MTSLSAVVAEGQPSKRSLRQTRNEALLYGKLAVPEAFLTTVDGHTFGGDVRIGDLNGDGRCDFLVYRCHHGAPRGAHQGGMKPCFLGAFEMDGTELWSAGEGGNQPSRPMSVALHDMTGDGAADVICFWHRPSREIDADWQSLADVVVQIRDGRTGRVIRESAPDAVTRRRRKDSVGANWVHQRLLIAGFRDTDRPRDFVVKLGDTYVAIDEQLEVLWTYRSKWNRYSHCPAYIPAVGDIDGDGRDEVNGGYFLHDHTGKPLWEKKLARHMDSVAIAPWDGGRMRAICSGYGHVMSAEGKTVLSLGKKSVPHGQEVRVADFRAKLPGAEMVIRNQGHHTSALLISSDRRNSSGGTVVERFQLNASPNNVGMTVVYWNGVNKPALLFNGGWLWDLETMEGRPLPDLPPPSGKSVHRMAFYHAIPSNLCGDGREELVLWDPTARHVYVYTPRPHKEAAYRGFEAGPRQWNPRLMD